MAAKHQKRDWPITILYRDNPSAVLSPQLHNLCLGNRAREIIPLAEFAAQLLQQQQLTPLFYTFCNNFEIQLFGEHYNGLNYLQVCCTFLHAPDEKLVNLQAVNRKSMKITQA